MQSVSIQFHQLRYTAPRGHTQKPTFCQHCTGFPKVPHRCFDSSCVIRSTARRRDAVTQFRISPSLSPSPHSEESGKKKQPVELKPAHSFAGQGFCSTFLFSFFCIYCPRGLQAVHNLLPDCEVGIHGNQGLKAHCSAGDNRREEHVSGCAFIKKKIQ